MASGSIKKNDAGKYVLRYRDDAGKQHWRTFDKKKNAEKELATIVAAPKGYCQEQKEIRFADLAANWMQYKTTTTRGRTVESQLDKRILPTFGPLWVRSITRKTVRDWEGDLLGAVKSPTTAGHTITVLKSILNMAVEDDYLVKSPAITLKKPKRLKAKVDFLTAGEIQAFLTATDRRDYCMLLTAVMTGVSAGNSSGLRGPI